MKRTTLLTVVCFLFVQSVVAGGLLTNANQSAQYIRMLSRNASTDLDAVYFNPAGVMEMADGFHFGFHSQTLFQTRTITTTAPLNNQEFVGKLQIPVFPTAFAVYKKENWAFSFGFGPNAGGGTATYDKGLPSFEGPIAQVVPALAGLQQIDPSLNVTGYSSEIAFEGSSVFWGIQLGASTKLNEMISVYGGVRYLPSVNTYTGSIRNIQLNVGGNMLPAPGFLTQTSGVLSGLATQASSAATMLSGTAQSLQPIIDNGAGGYTLQQLEDDGYIDASTRQQVEGGLVAIGYTPEQINVLTVTDAQVGFSSAADTYSGQAQQLSATSSSLTDASSNLEDKEVDTKQTGMGFTPILGVNISPSDKLNIGLRYEFQTVLKLTNDTEVDDTGMFPDKAESRSDIPAILSVGVNYKPSKKWLTSVSFINYFDKGVDWGNNVYGQERIIESGLWELSAGVQYNVTDRFALSVGGMQSTTGVSEQYQSDFSYSNSSNSMAFGFQWKATEQLTLDAGVLYTTYKDEDKSFGTYTETYDKENLGIAIGLSYSIFR